MLHVGNDIVDLNHPLAKGKSRDFRFRKRVFLPDEENIIESSDRPDAVLWALWTGKETAYKILRKSLSSVASAPRLYEVRFPEIEGCGPLAASEKMIFAGTVATPMGEIFIQTSICRDYAHSFGASMRPGGFSRGSVAWGVDSLPRSRADKQDESFYARESAKKRLAPYFNIGTDRIEIKRHGDARGLGPPRVYFDGKTAPTDLSLSHDGAFTACAFTYCA